MKHTSCSAAGRRLPQKILLAVFVGLGAGYLVHTRLQQGALPPPLFSAEESPAFTVYVPPRLDRTTAHPLIVVLSPDGDPHTLMSRWTGPADERQWIIAGSKTAKNGVDMSLQLRQLRQQIAEIVRRYPIDTGKIVMTGLSGGGMLSHFVSRGAPDLVQGVVINTGMMDESTATANYPGNKFAVFIASPTDFRFDEMHTDAAFLRSHGWAIDWVEFTGGHTIAPQPVYDRVADIVAARLARREP